LIRDGQIVGDRDRLLGFDTRILSHHRLTLDDAVPDGLVADKGPIRTIASNTGHALGVGIVPEGRARAVADRLLADDLSSG
jgi:glycogen debranching enzyme